MADYTLLDNGGTTECHKLVMKMVEEQDKFIIEYIIPYCESVLKTPLPKEKLIEILQGNKKLQAENERLKKKLDAYEASTLTPKEVLDLYVTKEMIEAVSKAKVGHINELLDAEEQGRLVVLDEPRKPIIWGDTKPKEPSYYNPAIKHNYCPMCGRKLSGTGTNVPTYTQPPTNEVEG